jgi:hypothetical protein
MVKEDLGSPKDQLGFNLVIPGYPEGSNHILTLVTLVSHRRRLAFKIRFARSPGQCFAIVPCQESCQNFPKAILPDTAHLHPAQIQFPIHLRKQGTGGCSRIPVRKLKIPLQPLYNLPELGTGSR